MLFRLLLPSINRHPEFINPLALYLDHAPTRDLPATFPYCCPVTVLEWKIGYSIVLPPVAELESLIFHSPHPLRILSNGQNLTPCMGLCQMRHPLPA